MKDILQEKSIKKEDPQAFLKSNSKVEIQTWTSITQKEVGGLSYYQSECIVDQEESQNQKK